MDTGKKNEASGGTVLQSSEPVDRADPLLHGRTVLAHETLPVHQEDFPASLLSIPVSGPSALQ